ncbi:MAG: peptidoglycan-binding domain-containing protein, partial [Pseudomonadota bacterium]
MGRSIRAQIAALGFAALIGTVGAPFNVSVAQEQQASSGVRITAAQIAKRERDAVFTLQTLLNQLGHQAGRADGIAGRKTRAAIRSFQRNNGLTVTGVIAETELNLLYRLIAPPEAIAEAQTPPGEEVVADDASTTDEIANVIASEADREDTNASGSGLDVAAEPTVDARVVDEAALQSDVFDTITLFDTVISISKPVLENPDIVWSVLKPELFVALPLAEKLPLKPDTARAHIKARETVIREEFRAYVATLENLIAAELPSDLTDTDRKKIGLYLNRGRGQELIADFKLENLKIEALIIAAQDLARQAQALKVVVEFTVSPDEKDEKTVPVAQNQAPASETVPVREGDQARTPLPTPERVVVEEKDGLIPRAKPEDFVARELANYEYHRLETCRAETGLAVVTYTYLEPRRYDNVFTDLCFDRERGRVEFTERVSGLYFLKRDEFETVYETALPSGGKEDFLLLNLDESVDLAEAREALQNTQNDVRGVRWLADDERRSRRKGYTTADVSYGFIGGEAFKGELTPGTYTVSGWGEVQADSFLLEEKTNDVTAAIYGTPSITPALKGKITVLEDGTITAELSTFEGFYDDVPAELRLAMSHVNGALIGRGKALFENNKDAEKRPEDWLELTFEKMAVQ